MENGAVEEGREQTMPACTIRFSPHSQHIPINSNRELQELESGLSYSKQTVAPLSNREEIAKTSNGNFCRSAKR